MTQIVWSPQSLRDIEGIRSYIAQDSPGYADFTVRRIVAAVERLVDFPESGRIVPERNQRDIREVIVRKFRVVYRLGGETVEIVTVFRESQEFSKQL